MDEEKLFKLVLLKDAHDFLKSLPQKTVAKIFKNIDIVAAGNKDRNLFKKLKNSEIWEFRTEYGGNAYRLFAFWDTNMETLVVATHGILKKTQKTPQKEIEKAEKIRENYFKENNN
jgi:phage-related protein